MTNGTIRYCLLPPLQSVMRPPQKPRFFEYMDVSFFQYVFLDGLTGLGQAKYSIWLSLIRKVVIFIPCIYLIPLIMKGNVEGSFLAEPIADIIAVITTAICFVIIFKKTMKSISALDMKTSLE